jgi:hypothetical protein
MFAQYVHDLCIPRDPVNHAYDLDVVILKACFFRHEMCGYTTNNKEEFMGSDSVGKEYPHCSTLALLVLFLKHPGD